MRQTIVRNVRGLGLWRWLKRSKDDLASSSKEQKEKTSGMVSALRTDEKKQSPSEMKLRQFGDNAQTVDMDAIRARGMLRFRHNYEPPENVREKVNKVVSTQLSSTIDAQSSSGEELLLSQDLKLKAKVLSELAREFGHCVPSSELHEMRTTNDLIQFYSRRQSNLSPYAQEARQEHNLPSNLFIAEQPTRFHPEDKNMYHGGVTAFPGTGGNVITIRNKRLLRQFRPKKEWYDYEDRSYDYSPLDKDMPWDREVAAKMDRDHSSKYNARLRSFRKI